MQYPYMHSPWKDIRHKEYRSGASTEWYSEAVHVHTTQLENQPEPTERSLEKGEVGGMDFNKGREWTVWNSDKW